jgi:hypothetical protein
MINQTNFESTLVSSWTVKGLLRLAITRGFDVISSNSLPEWNPVETMTFFSIFLRSSSAG